MIINNIKIAVRSLRKNKAYTIVSALGLTLSITCCVLIFLLIKYHLSFDNFHSNSDRIYRIVTEMHRDNINYSRSVPAPLGQSIRNDYTFWEKLARIATFEEQLIIVKDESGLKKFKEKQGIAFAESSFFEIFNYPLIKGNKQVALQEINTAIITESIAKKYFGDDDPMGKTLWLEKKIGVTITGVLKNLPSNTERQTEIYVSYPTLKAYNNWMASDEAWGGIHTALQCFVLLKPNASIPVAEKAIFAYVAKYRPNSKNVHHYKFQALADLHFNANYDGVMEKKNLWVLSIIGFFLLVTACVNFINLATARAFNRAKEVGVRKVLGSSRKQLFFQFISETSVITFSAILLSLISVFLVLPYVNNLFKIQIYLNLFSDKVVLLFLFGLGLLVTLLAGTYPSLVLSNFRPVQALKGKLTQKNIGGFNTRRALILVQFCISQILIIGMLVVMRQMHYAKQADLGFDKEAILMVPLAPDSTNSGRNAIKSEIVRMLGVEKVSLCYAAPSSQYAWNNGVKFDNQTEDANFLTCIKAADPDYLSTFSLELIAGRNLLPSDTVKEILVNETFIRKLNLQSPKDVIGKFVTANGGEWKIPIVGVIKDFHDRSLHAEISAVAITTNSEMYEKYSIKINLKNAKSILTQLEALWNLKYPEQIFEYQFLDQEIEKFYESEELFLRLIKFFSFIAIFIGCLGLYGLVSFMIAQKQKEIGIRKVIGSSILQIFWIFGKEFSRLIVMAFLIAAPLGWWIMNNWLQDFKFRIEMGVWTFLAAIFISIFIAVITVTYRVYRAASENPIKAIRSE